MHACRHADGVSKRATTAAHAPLVFEEGGGGVAVALHRRPNHGADLTHDRRRREIMLVDGVAWSGDGGTLHTPGQNGLHHSISTHSSFKHPPAFQRTAITPPHTHTHTHPHGTRHTAHTAHTALGATAEAGNHQWRTAGSRYLGMSSARRLAEFFDTLHGFTTTVLPPAIAPASGTWRSERGGEEKV